MPIIRLILYRIPWKRKSQFHWNFTCCVFFVLCWFHAMKTSVWGVINNWYKHWQWVGLYLWISVSFHQCTVSCLLTWCQCGSRLLHPITDNPVTVTGRGASNHCANQQSTSQRLLSKHEIVMRKAQLQINIWSVQFWLKHTNFSQPLIKLESGIYPIIHYDQAKVCFFAMFSCFL